MTILTIKKQIALGLCFTVAIIFSAVKAQIVIGAPSLGFSQACASEEFNSYSTSFVFSPEASLEASNQFIIELSDADGDFANAEVIYTTTSGEITSSPASISFSIPESTAGENYKIRIKSTAPAATSSSSNAFAAYYKLQDSPFSINNLVSTGAFCSGSSYLLTIDNPGINANDSPLNYPSLTFNWYRETSATTSVFVAEGETLEVNTEGTYFVETNYGSCTSNSVSNKVTITEASNGQADATIASSLGNPYCPAQGLTTLTTIGGLSYQWFRDGEVIDGATNQMYQTNESRNFSVQVDLGECMASGSINLISELFNSDINVDSVNYLEEGETLTITITDDANNPTYEWFLNNTLLSETSATLEASEFGNYTVIISENNGCTGAVEYQFSIQEAIEQFPDVANIPNVISPNGDTINDTWIIPQEYTSGSNTLIRIFSSQGKLVFETNDYLNDWPQGNLELTNINQVFYYIIDTVDGKTEKGSITVIK
ncbi:protein involved in gliding motility SprC [Winogradskyella wandonensis]|uniref:Protein involved in gliding motility SprC n=1 Tax=Winogradskyella wandonensis TaxID=1442586 RepID=A0A4R1KXG7_9FLAO|nr:gliding motility-associated C-terminal domain-containing protein [Winogradskyella wandonensis]TCK69293.1 protein involved in gliding motility SprC [Winogradskyella wandonensis]